jgi:DNA (cytosine-5)-methyltransferase 1
MGLVKAGMTPAWMVEIDEKCNQLLERRFPGVPRYRDVREVGKHNLEPIDILVGGSPCQDVSMAGKRKGLAGERSGLWFEYRRVLEELNPSWFIFENVTGMLQSNGGRDFATVLRGMVECGYGVAYRVLNSEYFGLAQRRRRVFVVGHRGDGRAAEVLFEPEAMPGNVGTGETPRADFAQVARGGVKFPVWWDGGYKSDTLTTRIHDQFMPDIGTFGAVLAFGHSGGETVKINDKANAITTETGSGTTAMIQGVVDRLGIRRLTPLECERLMGFEPGWTDGFKDGARYKMLGNAVCPPVALWIARRIVDITKGLDKQEIGRASCRERVLRNV